MLVLTRKPSEQIVIGSDVTITVLKIEGNKVRIRFKHTGGGLVARDSKPLSHFEIAADDGRFVPATAIIDAAAVVVQSDKVRKPTAVRFGWHEEAEPNLSNKEGLPASPFWTKPSSQ